MFSVFKCVRDASYQDRTSSCSVRLSVGPLSCPGLLTGNINSHTNKNCLHSRSQMLLKFFALKKIRSSPVVTDWEKFSSIILK